MRRMPLAVYLWPALPQIWRRGSWNDLARAVAFGVLLNSTLLASVIWVELWPEVWRRVAWAAVGAVWVVSALYSVYWEHRWGHPAGEDGGEAFGQAVDEYLQGNWFEAERLLRRLLAGNPRDHDARLMLATLLRHSGCYPTAREELDCLSRYDGAEKWALEIARERELLDETEAASAVDDVSQDAAEEGLPTLREAA